MKNEIRENCIWSHADAFQTLSIASVISNQYIHIAIKPCKPIEQMLLSVFPLS